ncbi:hypothetical protein ACFYZB_17295 [Streptomyces sp. NPDC001852]|uniref:hypothetical protein n=1 Tax=Streptomyces sp. NPDC001852 TaxID=3364619 RepID=UPI0036B6F547
MADEQYKWLNRETAERLLRGEPLEAVDPSARDQAERLSRALGALTSQTDSATGELPGEQAALAAFRKAREAAGTEHGAVGRADGSSGLPAPGADAGLVRIGAPARTGIPARRPRWGRPLRLALAAAVAVGTVGGVAMAAGTGMLPTPFGPEQPATSVSADPTARTPSASVPQGTPGVTPGPGVPSGGAGTNRGGGSGAAVAPGDRTGGSTAPGTGEPSGTPGGRWRDAASACRDIRDGKELDAGRRRALENLAGGTARVSRYCKVVLDTLGSVDGTIGGKGDENGDKGKDKGKGGGQGDDEGSPGQGGDGHPGWGGNGGGKGNGGKGNGGGKGRHRDDAAPTAFAPTRPARTTGTVLGPAPSPTYTAL